MLSILSVLAGVAATLSVAIVEEEEGQRCWEGTTEEGEVDVRKQTGGPINDDDDANEDADDAIVIRGSKAATTIRRRAFMVRFREDDGLLDGYSLSV